MAFYKQDGTLDRVVATEVPSDTFVQDFAVNDNSVLYIQGFRAARNSKNSMNRGYAAILNSDGKLVKDLSQAAPQVDSSVLGIPQGQAVAGADGRFYILGPSSVRVLDASGTVERHLDFVKPTPEAIVNRIDYSGGLIMIEFYLVRHIPGFADAADSRVLILDAQTGEVRGDYVFDPQLTNSVLCFSRKEGFSMLAIGEKKNMAIDLIPLQ